MKRILLALTVLLLFTLVGCDVATTTTTTTETTTVEITTTDVHIIFEQILYDILVVEYATESCTREELNDYLWDYENEINIESERIVTLLDMIEQQLDGE